MPRSDGAREPDEVLHAGSQTPASLELIPENLIEVMLEVLDVIACEPEKRHRWMTADAALNLLRRFGDLLYYMGEVSVVGGPEFDH